MARVYVSSTYSDLVDCRRAVSEALRKLGHEDVAMEHYAADPRRPLDRCLEDVGSSDLYVGIFAWRYGYIPPGQQRSISELEYRHARKTERACFIFLLRENAPWPPERVEIAARDRVIALRNELKTHSGVGEFTGPVDLAAAVATALALWMTNGRSPGAIQLAPPLPAHYIERPEVVNGIAAELLDEASDRAGVLVVTALHGLGGIGKTAAATAIAHSRSIRNHFRNGVLWATLGQNPDSLSHLAAWIHALGDPEYRPTTTIAATSYLRTLLYSTKTLLIVDDVWEFEHAAPFIAGGSQCRLLVTTRRAEVADALNARLYSVSEMTPKEAVDLLRKRIETGSRGRAFAAAEWEHAAALARDTGYLPLALALMGGLVARGYPWAEARAALQRERSRRMGSSSHAQTTLEATLQLSLDYLRETDRPAWESVAWLGVLSDKVLIDPRTAAVLWSVAPSVASSFLNALADDAILQRNGSEFRVHDLMHDVVRNVLTADAPAGVGIPLTTAHAELLSRYGTTIAAGRWDQLADDGYIHSHLVWHFEQSGDEASIQALLRLSNEDRQHAWYAARDRLGQAAGFISDLTVAWRLVRAGVALSLADQCRHALVLASLHSLAHVITPKMLYGLVRRGIWLPPKALDYLNRGIDAQRRGNALLELIPLLLEQGGGMETRDRDDLVGRLLLETETVIGSGANATLSALLLLAMATQFSGARQRSFVERAIAFTDGKPETLRELGSRVAVSLRDTILQRAAESCREISDPLARVAMLARVVAELSGPEVKTKWTTLIEQWTATIFTATHDPAGKTRAGKTKQRSNRDRRPPGKGEPLATDADGRSGESVEAVKHDPRATLLQLMIDRPVGVSREWILKMAKNLDGDDATFLVERVKEREARDRAAKHRAAGVAKEDLESLLERGQVAELDEVVNAIAALPEGRDDAIADAMEAYGHVRSSEEKGEILTRLAPYASEGCCRREAEKLAAQADRPPIGAQCLLANLAPEAERRQRFDVVIETMKSMWGRYEIDAAMIAVIRVAPAEVVHRAVASLQRIDDAAEQVGAVFVVAPYLTDGLSSDVRQFLENQAANKAHIVTLTRMVAELSQAMNGGVLSEFVREAARMSSEWWIVEALTLTMLRLDDRSRLSAILRAVQYITASDLKARLVTRLAIRMARLGYVEDAMRAAMSVPIERDRWIILADVAADLAVAGKMLSAQRVAAAIAHPEDRGKAMAEIALHVASRGDVRLARDIAGEITDELWRTWIQERLDLLRDDSQPAAATKKRPVVATESPAELDLASIATIAGELMLQQPECRELRDLAAAAAADDVARTLECLENFWRAKFAGEKTYLEVLAEQPRPKLLRKFQQLAPLLGPALGPSGAEEFVAAVRDVSAWWP
jgi:hypothetical protein